MRGKPLRFVLLALALIALSVRAAAPPGYMLTPQHGRLVVALCGDGAVTLDLGVSHPVKPKQEHAPCAFATAAAEAAPPATAALHAPVLFALAAPSPPAPARVGEGLAAPPPPSTGPPERA